MTAANQLGSSGGARPSRERRAAIVAAVKTPLGFFALVVLAVEVILAFAVSVTDGFDRRLLVVGMVSLIFILVLIVAALAVWRPDALYGKRSTVAISVTAGGNRSIDAKEGGEEGAAVTLVRKPKFLVAGSSGEPWESLVGEDKSIIHNAFPKADIQTHHNATVSSLGQEMLRLGAFDILQLACNINSQGDLQLSDTTLTAKGISRLIDQSKVKLVVLAACSSATLAAEVAPYSNMVAATGDLSVEGWSKWSSIFYSLLANGVPLSQAYSIAQEVIDLPVTMILHRETRLIQ